MDDDFEDLQKMVMELTYEGLSDRFEQAKGVVRRAARQQAATIFRWMSDEIMQDMDGLPPVLAAYTSEWPILSDNEYNDPATGELIHLGYRSKKEALYNSQAFFHGLPRKRDSADLHSVLSRTDPVAAFHEYLEAEDDEDVEELEFAQHGRTSLVDMTFRHSADGLFRLYVTLFPRLPTNPTNAALATMIADAAADPLAFHKLVNHRSPERPFALPALLYFANELIPAAIDDALRSAGFLVVEG